MDGQPDRAHLIPQQRMKRAGIRDHEVLWDDRAWVKSCRTHHELFDHKMLRLDEGEYPDDLREFAAEIGFYWAGRRDGWRKEHTEREAA